MKLAEALQAAKEKNLAAAPEEIQKILLEETDKLLGTHISENAPKVGDSIADFTLSNAKGEMVTLFEELKKGPVVLSFYRGGWCPYCNLELRALQATLPEIKEAGASLIAVTPETPDNSLTTIEKNEMDFDVVSDIDNVYAKSLGLVFKLPQILIDLYKQFGLDLEAHNGNKNFELPMPGTYVIGTDGKITFAFASEDYTLRAEPSDIVAALKK